MNKVWTQVMDIYEFKIYDAAHSTCGLGEMFSFLMESFENPPAKPDRWHHADVYPSFLFGNMTSILTGAFRGLPSLKMWTGVGSDVP